MSPQSRRLDLARRSSEEQKMVKWCAITCLILHVSLSQALELEGKPHEKLICEMTGSSRHDVACARKRFEAVEARLNVRYAQLLELLDSHVEKEPERLRMLKTNFIQAQRAWIKFREAECKAVEAWYTRGTLQQAYYYSCMESLASKRIDDFVVFATPDG
jgi:uncharacterized protein YecT (DUF1311 family)